jgi:hypothetical protein
MRPVAIAAAAALCSACLHVRWERESRYAPVPEAGLETLEAGRGLDECLDALGAPLWVWEHVERGRPGAALAWGWFDEETVGVSLSVPVSDYASLSLDYDDVDRRMRGVVLFFDEDLRLAMWRTGFLHDITGEVRRPSAPEEILEETPEEGA